MNNLCWSGIGLVHTIAATTLLYFKLREQVSSVRMVVSPLWCGLDNSPCPTLNIECEGVLSIGV